MAECRSAPPPNLPEHRRGSQPTLAKKLNADISSSQSSSSTELYWSEQMYVNTDIYSGLDEARKPPVTAR
jgi:hypothetical protein